MASSVLYRIYTARWIFRTKHVRGGCGGELPSMPRGAGERGEGQESS